MKDSRIITPMPEHLIVREFDKINRRIDKLVYFLYWVFYFGVMVSGYLIYELVK